MLSILYLIGRIGYRRYLFTIALAKPLFDVIRNRPGRQICRRVAVTHAR